MSVIGWKGLHYTDEIVWEKLEVGDLSGLEFEEKQEFAEYARRMHPRTIEDIAVALGLQIFGLFDKGDVERYLQARENQNNNGPFPELVETYGYPIFKEQMITVMKTRLQIDDKVYELADGIAKRKNTAMEYLYSFTEVERKTLDNILKYVARTASRRFYTHFANVIYEALWILNNGRKESFAENPIVIGKWCEQNESEITS